METKVDDFILRFDEETHTYWSGKLEVPGVNRILRSVGLAKDYSQVDDFYRDRGILVAQTIEFFLKGILDESSLDSILVPYFEGFKRYWDKHHAPPVAIEEPKGHKGLWFAGRADLVTAEKVVDWKCSKSHDKVAELQGEGYKMIWGPYRSFDVVQFPGDGTFEIHEYGDKVDTWPSVMKCFRWFEKAHPRTKVKGYE